MAKKCAFYGCILAFAIICGYVEFLIPFDFGIPGIKLGLANITAVFLLYKNGFLPALVVNTARILLCGLLFGSIISIFYSLCGGILSLLVMAAIKRAKCFSPVGVSIAGAAAHNAGQIAAAIAVIGVKAVIYYLPILTVAGVVTGFLVGIAAAYMIARMKPIT